MMKKKQIIILVSLLLLLSTIICFLFLYLGIFWYKLDDFKIIGLVEDNSNLYLKYEKLDNVSYYEVYGIDENDNVIFYEKTDDNKVSLNNLYLSYNEEISFKVVAGNERESKESNIYNYMSKEASFKENEYIVGDGDFLLLIEGIKERLELNVIYRDNIIYKTNVESEQVFISKDIINDYEGRLTAILKNSKGRIISIYNFYNNPVLVEDAYIDNISDNEPFYLEDILVKVSGGKGSTSMILNLYQDKKFIKEFRVEDGSVKIPVRYFKENTDYTLEVVAKYLDYDEIAKRDVVNIKVLGVAEVAPVYLNYYENNIKDKSLISLNTLTEGATIFYTLDNSDPLTNGFIYTGAFEVSNGMTLKVAAKKNGYLDSAVRSYEIKIKSKTPVVYLSPSNQYDNYGISGSGYTNEREMMNKLGDIVYEKLKEAGIIVYRNNPDAPNKMLDWARESRSVEADLHVAIHSNGSPNHTSQGVLVYVHDENSLAYDAAANIFKNLNSIYPYNYKTLSNGVLFSDGSLGEINPLNVKRGLMIEVAYHDQMDDAKWIVANLQRIGDNIANSIISYLQMEE